MDSTQHTRLVEEIKAAPGKVAADYAVLARVSTRTVFKWLRTDEDARALVKQGFVAIEENKPIPDWALDESGTKYPAIKTGRRTEKAPERDIGALVCVPDRLNDEELDKKLDEFRAREIAKLGPRPRQTAVADANIEIMKFKDLLNSTQKNQILREAAEDAKANRDEMITEKDKRLAIQELLIEQLQSNLTPSGRPMNTRPSVGRH